MDFSKKKKKIIHSKGVPRVSSGSKDGQVWSSQPSNYEMEYNLGASRCVPMSFQCNYRRAEAECVHKPSELWKHSVGSKTFLQHYCAKCVPPLFIQPWSPFPSSFLCFLPQHSPPHNHCTYAAEKIALVLWKMGLDSGRQVRFPGFPHNMNQYIDLGSWENIMRRERVEGKGKQEQWNTGGHTKMGKRREQRE